MVVHAKPFAGAAKATHDGLVRNGRDTVLIGNGAFTFFQ